MANPKSVAPVPWWHSAGTPRTAGGTSASAAGPHSEGATLPKWLVTAPSPISENPFDTSIAPESTEPPPFDEALYSAMVAASMGQAATGAARDWQAEISGLQKEVAELRALLATLTGAADKLKRQLFESCERDAVQLAVTIAERVVDRELVADPGLIVRWVREALDALGGQHDVVVIVSQDVLDAVPPEMWRDMAGNALAPRVDADLPPGSCEVKGEHSRIDVSAAARIGAIVEALGVETKP